MRQCFCSGAVAIASGVGRGSVRRCVVSGILDSCQCWGLKDGQGLVL